MLAELLALVIKLAPEELQLITSIVSAIRDLRNQKITAEQARATAADAMAKLLSTATDPRADATKTDAAVDAELATQFPTGGDPLVKP